MAFTAPQFNLLFDWWAPGTTPSGGEATFTNLPGQLYINWKGGTQQFGAIIRMPVDLTKSFSNEPATATHGIVEIPAGSGIFYETFNIYWVHQGFPNEYWAMTAIPCLADGTPNFGHVP